MTEPVTRDARLHDEVAGGDQRDWAQRDRDRVLYTYALRRLAGVTQVVGADEGHVFHNRLTHTLETAQIARRLAESFLASKSEDISNAIEQAGGIHPEVCEAAALAHDLGHPPFGHIAEDELNRLAISEEAYEGYEGNAQSFRIVTKLAAHRPQSTGLNLSRATLNAILKYPWLRAASGARLYKWGAYSTELEGFDFARGQHEPGDDTPSLEAQIMTWADDIAYCVHDTEDFYRAGLIPLEKFSIGLGAPGPPPPEIERFLVSAFERFKRQGRALSPGEEESHKEAFLTFCGMLNVDEPYRGSNSQRGALRGWTATMIGMFVRGTTLQVPDNQNAETVVVTDECKMACKMLKQLTWTYVIENPSLAAQQHGQRLIIRKLFEVFGEASSDPKRFYLLPPANCDQMNDLRLAYGDAIPEVERLRVVADTISSMTDQQAYRMYQRLMGTLPGSVLDPIMR